MNSWMSPLYSLLFLALWRVSYEAANGIDPGVPLDAPKGPEQSTPTRLPPLQKKWTEKAVQKYAEAQDKKWSNWVNSMFDHE